MSSSSKRQSIAPSSGPKPPVNFSSSLTIPKDASLTGHHSITIQAETVIHPRARIDSTQGSVLIGRRCVIQERAQLGAQPGDRSSLSSTGGITLGDYVIVEAGATVEPGGTEISEGTFIQVGSTIGRGAKVGKNCTISPKSVVRPGEVLPDNTVVFSNGQRRTDRRRVIDVRKVALLKQINVTRKMIRSEPDRFR
ncbi:unnamed protein product [Clonostachys rhizophaga]|uniref:Dynactin subunit 6 n=1 Tax=Clonostachys rhizophaga TaxID=160324 RepID=A0A9N9UY26_9HYPO|nr:unnamed protein product [Clonostachys rhizophaga]